VRNKAAVLKEKDVQQAIREAEALLLGKGRILVRPSGTQPLVRIMAEGPEEKILREAVEMVAEAVRRANQLLTDNTAS